MKDGGLAFPRPAGTTGPCDAARYNHSQTGVTLRDWFAGQAMAAIPHIGCGADLDADDFAIAAYQFADAMLQARKGGES